MRNGDCTFFTPAGVCLFGEHQDYLQLPVVPCAISLRITIRGEHQNERSITVEGPPDISSQEDLALDEPAPDRHNRDYLRSGLNVMRRHGYSFNRGIRASVRSAIPINAGTSSSSALLVTWVALLARLSDQEKTPSPEECARYAHEAEVLEFGEPGGQMDHYSTALGGILAIEFAPALRIDRTGRVAGRLCSG